MLSSSIKIIWDIEIRTDCVISAHRLDIVIHDCIQCSATLLDVSIPTLLRRNMKSIKNTKICVWNYNEFGTFEQPSLLLLLLIPMGS